jgi:hypothetical protein
LFEVVAVLAGRVAVVHALHVLESWLAYLS